MRVVKNLFVMTLLLVVGVMAVQLLVDKAQQTGISPYRVQAAALPMPAPQPINDLVNLAVGQWRCEFYDNRDLLGAPVYTQTLPELNVDWGLGQPSSLLHVDDFSARCRSKQNAPILSIYKLHFVVDDGVRLFMDGQLILDGWRSGQQSAAVHVPLQAGMHEVQIEYFEAGGTAKLALDIHEGCNAWTGRYYPNPNFEGVPVLIDCNGTSQGPFAFDIGEGFPKFMNGVDAFSVRWEQNIRFAERGKYQFQIEADDGAEIYIGNNNVYARMNDNIGADTFTVDLTAGIHLIQVRYADRGGAARFKMSWARVG